MGGKAAERGGACQRRVILLRHSGEGRNPDGLAAIEDSPAWTPASAGVTREDVGKRCHTFRNLPLEGRSKLQSSFGRG